MYTHCTMPIQLRAFFSCVSAQTKAMQNTGKILHCWSCYMLTFCLEPIFYVRQVFFDETDLYHRIRSCAKSVTGTFFLLFYYVCKKDLWDNKFILSKHQVHMWTVSALSHSSLEICVYLASLYTEHNTGLSVSQAFSFNPPYLHCFHCIVLVCF